VATHGRRTRLALRDGETVSQARCTFGRQRAYCCEPRQPPKSFRDLEGGTWASWTNLTRSDVGARYGWSFFTCSAMDLAMAEAVCMTSRSDAWRDIMNLAAATYGLNFTTAPGIFPLASLASSV